MKHCALVWPIAVVKTDENRWASTEAMSMQSLKNIVFKQHVLQFLLGQKSHQLSLDHTTQLNIVLDA